MAEMWDLYNGNRELLDKKHTRGVPIPAGLYHIIVEIWTITKEGKILITQRHPDKPHGLCWECTGGSVIAGEQSLPGALRELYEEVGLKAGDSDLILINSNRVKDRFVDTYVYIYNFKLEDLVLQKEEVVGARLVSFDELCELCDMGLFVSNERFNSYKDKIKSIILGLKE